MRERVEYAAVWLLLKIFGALPRPVSRAVAATIARLLFLLLPKLRKTAELNLRLAFPGATNAQRTAITRGMLRNLGWMAAEFARLPRYTKQNIERYVILDGHENFLEGKRQACRYFLRWELPKVGPMLDRLSVLDGTFLAVDPASL